MPLFNLVSTRTRTNDPTMTHQYLNESKKNTKEKLTRKKSHDEILKERKMMKGTKKY